MKEEKDTWKETWNERKKDRWLVASLIFFGLACVSPMVAPSYIEYGVSGFTCFFGGWFGRVGSFKVVMIFLTNFLYFPSLWIAYHKSTFGLVPVLLAMMSFFTSILFLVAMFITRNDRGNNDDILHIGYYFWIASTFTIMISTMRRWWNTK